MADSERYPKRGRYFANRFLRILTKTCAAQDISPEGCWLLTVVASLEDAKHYSAPVTFYNGQLMALTAFTREHSFISVRRRVVEAGWLHYEPGRKRKPGRYWVTIPERFTTIPDGTCDEDPGDYTDENDSESGVDSLADSPTKASVKAEGKRQSKRRESVSQSVSPPYPIPSPIPPPPTPSPIAESVSSASEGGGGGFDSWQEVEREVRKLGVAKAAEAISGAKSIGMTVESVRLVIRDWQQAKPAYDVGALYWRLVRGVWPERSGNGQEEKWVEQEKRQTQRTIAALGARPQIDPDEPSLKEQLLQSLHNTEGQA